MKNYMKYSDGHWSVDPNKEAALNKYLRMYEDIYNKTNLNRILNSIPEGKKMDILDYGGGVGIVSVALAQAGHNVTLIDAAENSIKTALYHAKKNDVEISATTFDHLSQGEGELGTYDVIVAKDVLEHVVEDGELLSSFFQNLRDNGLLILTTQNSSSPNYLIEGGIRKIMRPKNKWMGWDRTHLRFYNPASLEGLARKVGFSTIDFDSGYIFPYKLASVLLPWVDCRKKTIFYSIDSWLMKRRAMRKYGWNIMMICKKT
jgi:2-polyprenyl-6-hydroxyphenyl methylase/3-demethylubiquinone-9 3-methyltransferase